MTYSFKYRIYQLPLSNNRIFRSFPKDGNVKMEDYCCTWKDEFISTCSDELAACEDIFYIFNQERPNNFGGHSLSVSDVVVFLDDNYRAKSLYYCDSFGFKKFEKEN